MAKFLLNVGDSLLGTTRNSFNPAALTGPSYLIDSELALTDPSHFHPKDEHGIPMNPDTAGGLTYFPTRVASCAFAHFNRCIEQEDATSHELFLRMAAWFMAAGDGIWRYHCDYTFADGTLKSPWISAMGQGQGISVLTRAYQLTGDRRYLDRARQALAPLLVPLAEGGVRSRIDGRWEFLEEYPLPRPRHTLNGFLYAMIGLVDLVAVMPEATEEVGLPSLTASLVHNLDRWQLGYWSAHDAHRTATGLPNPATVRYHRVHVAQLRWLGARLGEPALYATAERWFERQRHLCHRLRALRAKIAYRVAEPAGGFRAVPPDVAGMGKENGPGSPIGRVATRASSAYLRAGGGNELDAGPLEHGVDRGHCQSASNFDPCLECAPGTGQDQAAVLTVCRAWWSSN